MLSYHFLTDCAKHGYNLVFEYKGELIKTSFREAAANYKEFMEKYDVSLIAAKNPHLKLFTNSKPYAKTLYDPECWEVTETKDCNGHFKKHLHYIGTSVMPAQPLGLTNMYGLFRSCRDLCELDLGNWSLAEGLISTECMFEDCEKLKSIKFPMLPEIHNTSRMFRNCYSLREINWDAFKHSKLVACDAMFANCWVLEDFELDKLNFRKAFSAEAMFANCSGLNDRSLKKLPMSNAIKCNSMFLGTSVQDVEFKTSDIISPSNILNMFSHCPKLVRLCLQLPKNVIIDKSDIANNCYGLRSFAITYENSSSSSSDDNRIASISVF